MKIDEPPLVVSVNVGRPRPVQWRGRSVETAIWKEPVAGRVEVGTVNLEGDAQADLRVHGGPDKAVYAYGTSDYRWWSDRLGRELAPGTFGENLTISGMDLTRSRIGEVWRIGSARLQVTQPRLPCSKLGVRMDDPGFVEAFESAGRFGVYLRVLDPGELGAGDVVEVVTRPEHGLTATEIGSAGARPPTELLERILAVAEVAEGWRSWAERALERARSSSP